MQPTDIDKLIIAGEGIRIEFKESPETVHASFYETVVSFSNTDGGTILLGISDNGAVKGVNPVAKSNLIKNIVSSLNSPDCVNPPVYAQPFTVLHPLGEVVVVQIPASSQVHSYAGQIYIREFESDINVTNNQNIVGELYQRKRNFFTEIIIYPHLAIDDLDKNLFDKARQLMRSFRSDHPWLLSSNEQMLKDSVLWRKDFITGKEGLTLAAALIFGKDTTIQSLLPAFKIEAMVRINNKDRWDDRINPPLRTNLIDSYLELKSFINKHLPEKFFIESDQRIDLRDRIFREVIGNLIVHNEYTSPLSAQILITESAVTVTNPNKPLFHGLLNPLSFNPYPKNPNIRKFFTAFGWTDEIGSGIRNTNKYLPLYMPGASPVFWEDNVFRTEIPLQAVTFGKFANKFHAWLDLPEEWSNHTALGLSTISLPALLFGKDWEELILHLVPTWHQKGTNLPELNWPVKGANSQETIKKVPTWHQKGTHLLAKKVWYLISIITLTTQPVRLIEILHCLNYRNEKTFRDNYIKPLRSAGLITLTNLENINHPENRYTITPAGKLFLGGI